MSIQQFFDKALQNLNRRKSDYLGDRTLYIGASDIGTCPRKVVKGKLEPVEHTTRTLMRMNRGHLAEDLLAKIFTAGGAKFEQQMEVIHPVQPFKAHLDFVFLGRGKDAGMHVVEVKSVDGIPDEPYPTWIDQLHFQLGLLRDHYPTARIGGSVLAVDVNAGAVHEFGGYAPQPDVYEYLLNRGVHMLAALHGEEQPQLEVGILCGYCDYRHDCPAFCGEAITVPPEVDHMAQRYAELSEGKAEIDREMKYLKGEILSFFGERFRGNTEHVTIVVSTIGPSETVDSKLLQSDFPEIYGQVRKPRAGYTKLEVKELKRPKLKTAA